MKMKERQSKARKYKQLLQGTTLIGKQKSNQDIDYTLEGPQIYHLNSLLSNTINILHNIERVVNHSKEPALAHETHEK